MKNKKKTAQNNSALESFKHELPKNFIRDRFFALIIDLIIITLICQLAFTLFGMPDWGRYFDAQEAVKGLSASDPLVVERMRLYQECFIITLVIGMAYETLMMVFFGATIGKLLFGMRVVNAKEGENFFMVRLQLVFSSIIKTLSIYLLASIPFVFLCLTTFGNSDGRSGFDLFAGTKVINIRSN